MSNREPKSVHELREAFTGLATDEYRSALAFFALNAPDEEVESLQHGFWEDLHI